MYKGGSLYLAAVIICLNIAALKTDCGILDRVYVIGTKSRALYVGATNNSEIQLQEYDGSLGQLWRIDCGHMPGLFRFFNHGHGLFLSVLPYGDKLSPLILDNVSEEYWQEWFLNGNGRIVNAAILYNLDVTYGTFEPGNGVGVYPDTGDINQEWEIVQVFMDKK